MMDSMIFRLAVALFAQLRGTKEIGTGGRRAAGDRNGRGSFSALIEGRQLCFGVQVTKIRRPMAAHIHRGARGVNGPIVIPLRAPTAGSPGAAAGCVRAPSAVLSDISAHPLRYYANVHTMAFPGGAVRGQLFRRSN